MNFAELVFIAIICFTAGGALLAVLARSIIHAMLGLVATMFGIAGLYIYLNAPFIAMMQILIYVGAVTILIAFAIMLAGPISKRPREWTTRGKFAGALGVSVVSTFIIYFFLRAAFTVSGQRSEITTAEIGRVFFDKLILPFELISLLIVVSIIGAIMLALLSKGQK
ncbi:MAG: NADH-quinone oxidoreductase subunit J [Smithellaceae bacterium]|nr:NADH-quinone oxidoreductase subunit J [Smithellaceae bacterium]